MRDFQRKQHPGLISILFKNLKEPTNMEVPNFPDWVVYEEAIDDVLFEGELNEEEEEVVVEKKRKRSVVKEIQRGEKPVGLEEEIEEEEDLLAIDDNRESLSEGEKEDIIKMMKQLSKESEADDPTSEEEEDEFQDAGEKLDDADDYEVDQKPQNDAPVNEPGPENPRTQENQVV